MLLILCNDENPGGNRQEDTDGAGFLKSALWLGGQAWPRVPTSPERGHHGGSEGLVRARPRAGRGPAQSLEAGIVIPILQMGKQSPREL